MFLDRPDSLAIQVADRLRKRLRSDYSTGGQLPSEPKLASAFGVSRGTVRQALTILEREGVIFRRQGSGTYANKYVLRIQARAEKAHEFTKLLGLAGFTPGIELISIERQPLPEDIAARMDWPITQALMIQKLFLADGCPAITCLDVIPESLICDVYDDEELNQPIFDFLDKRCHQSVAQVLTEIIPVVADADLAERLGMTPGEPLLRFEEVGFNQTNQPVLFSRVYYNDQFIRFSVLRKKV